MADTLFRTITPTLLLLLCLASAFPRAARADDILIVADEWCPYNCAQDSETPGYIVELARQAFEGAGHRVIYRVVPWSRAIAGTRNGDYDAIIGAGRNEVPDFIFPEVAMGHASHRFYVRRESGWNYGGLDSLRDVNLGVIKDYSYGTLLKEYIAPNEHDAARITVITGDDALTRSILMLEAGRIDVLVEDRNVINWHFAQEGGGERFREAGEASTESLYIAFSPAKESSSSYARILDKATRDLREGSFMQGVLNKYRVAE